MRVALTQSEERLEGLEAALAARGLEVVRIPLVGTRPLLTPEVRRAARELLECPWLLFTSRSAVAAWQALGLPLAQRLGAVGPGTAAALRRAGAEVAVVGQPATAGGLARAFLAHPERAGPVGLPRGSRALPALPRLLGAQGVALRPLVVYRSEPLPWPEEQGEVDAVLLASPSAAAALPERVARRARLVALGRSTAAALERRGWPCAVADRPDVAAAVEVLEQALERTP